MKKILIVILIIISLRIIIPINGEVTYDPTNLENVFKTIYTTSLNQYDDRFHIAKIRKEGLKNYFTTEAYNSPWLNIFTISYSDRFYSLKSDTTFKTVEFELLKNKRTELRYKYTVYLELNNIVEDMYIIGELILLKEDNKYLINYMKTLDSNYEIIN